MCASSTSQAFPGRSSQSRPLILIIDDEPVIAQSLAPLLELLEYEVIAAETGERGMALFLQHAPAVTLVDLLMPVQDGIETIIQMRRRRPDASIIAISGGGHVEGVHYLAMAVKLGANIALEKPIDCDKLLIALRTLLASDPVAVARRQPAHPLARRPPARANAQVTSSGG